MRAECNRLSVRDWHLVDDRLLALFLHSRILDAVSALLGPDLLLWRSKLLRHARQ